MRRSVQDNFLAFTVPLEGKLDFLYLDVKGLVTTGVGNLVDPAAQVFALPWVREDGSPASRREVADAWMAVKRKQEWKHRGGMAFAPLTAIRLTDEGIRALVFGKLDQVDEVLAGEFPTYDTAPADAQLGLCSMAWALGPHFRAKWPKFAAAFDLHDFATCADECTMRVHDNPGVRPRNRKNRMLFRNAAAVLADEERESDSLYWPRELWPE